VPIPGATAFVAALSGSGLPSDQFLFAGFLPARASARRAKLEDFRATQATLIFYEGRTESPPPYVDAADILGNREGVVARELTKLHEEFVRGGSMNWPKTFGSKQSAGRNCAADRRCAIGRTKPSGIETVPTSRALANE